MPSQLQLVNRVLSELGRTPVTAITDKDNSIIIANKIDELFPEILLDCNWTWAIKYVNDGSPLVTNFSPDFTYTYQLPGDFGKFYRFATSGPQWGDYEFVDGYLLAQTKPVQYYYIVRDADYEVLPPLFARALILYTAAKVAPALTENQNLFMYLEKEYQKKRIDAILENDMQRSITQTPYNDFDRMNYV
jgi:hypothetical protein